MRPATASSLRICAWPMGTADGRDGMRRSSISAPSPPAISFTTVDDSAHFASALLANGHGLVKPATLAEMWHPQLTKDDAGFGLGFVVGKFREHRVIGHSGAVYGHSASFVLLPEQKLGVIVIGNEDIVNGRIHRISNAALSLLLEAKTGEQPPAPAPVNQPAEELAQFAGDYESPSYWAHLEVKDGKLAGTISGQATKFTAVAGPKFTADSRIDDAAPVTFERDAAGKVSGFSYGAKDPQIYRRVTADAPALPPEWRAYLGSYGPDFIPLIISERHGHLYAMTENMVDYRLTPVNKNVCAFPPGMYVDEQIVFLTDADGQPHAVNFANMLLQRR